MKNKIGSACSGHSTNKCLEVRVDRPYRNGPATWA